MKNPFIILIALFVSLSTYSQSCVWNMKSIDKAKAENSLAVQSIIRDANKIMTTTITTVVDKPMTPPSGDKHDYMSMGRYWWPNPNTKDGLPYIRKDGVSNPEIEKLDRYPLGNFAASVENLSLAYYFTSEEKYAAKAIENLQIWFINKKTKMNPNMNFGQTIPGQNNGKGRGEGVLDSYSFIEMLDAVELLKTSKLFTVADQTAVKEWFTAYLNWLLTSEIGNEENSAKNNHGTAFDVQATRYALFVGNVELAKKIINDFPAKRLFTQIEPNGAQPLELARTTALGYSTFNLTHYIDLCQMAKSLHIDLYDATSKDGRSIAKAIEFLVPFIGSDQSKFPYQQIKDWAEVQEKLCWQLYRADKLSKNSMYSRYYQSFINQNERNNNTILY